MIFKKKIKKIWRFYFFLLHQSDNNFEVHKKKMSDEEDVSKIPTDEEILAENSNIYYVFSKSFHKITLYIGKEVRK